jgi:hypothetical protein
MRRERALKLGLLFSSGVYPLIVLPTPYGGAGIP